MNPFALQGFSFLGFYLIIGIIVVWCYRAWILKTENDNAPTTPTLTDPYLIAHLRAGEAEALRVATVALLDRGMLNAHGEDLKAKNSETISLAKRPIEKAILKHYQRKGEAHAIFKDVGAKQACAAYQKELQTQGMLADSGVYLRRLLPLIVALGALIAVTVIKVEIALSQGRHNVGFLITLTIMLGIALLFIWRRRLTGRGEAMLDDLRDLFSRLKTRAKALRAGGQTNEAALLAAVFGLAALPTAGFPFMEKLYPSKAGDGSSCGSSSSCSSSSGSSCGGGCGGGGCGG